MVTIDNTSVLRCGTDRVQLKADEMVLTFKSNELVRISSFAVQAVRQWMKP